MPCRANSIRLRGEDSYDQTYYQPRPLRRYKPDISMGHGMGWILVLLVLGHLGMALIWHHLVRRDDLLATMAGRYYKNAVNIPDDMKGSRR